MRPVRNGNLLMSPLLYVQALSDSIGQKYRSDADFLAKKNAKRSKLELEHIGVNVLKTDHSARVTKEFKPSKSRSPTDHLLHIVVIDKL